MFRFRENEELYKKIFSKDRNNNEIVKSQKFNDDLLLFFEKIYNIKENNIFNILPFGFVSLGYIEEIGYYVVIADERGNYEYLEGFPCPALDKSFYLLINNLLQHYIQHYSEKYQTLESRYEYILDKWDKYFDGNISEKIIEEYENKLNSLELNNKSYKYNKEIKKFEVIINNRIRKEKLEELKKHFDELCTDRWEEREITKPFVTTTGYNCYLNNGMVLQREKISKGGNDGSAVIIVPEVNGEYLTVIEPRVFTNKTVAVGFPAGYIEKGENPEMAALRELREETGYVPENLEKLDSYYQDEGISGAYNHIYYACNCKKEYDQKLDEGEVIRYMLFNYDELLELEKKGYINGANSKLALAKIKRKEM